MGHSGFEMVSAVDIVEPDSEFGISDSWRSVGVVLDDFDAIGEKMSGGVSGDGCS